MSHQHFLPNGEVLVIGRSRSGQCEVHSWPDEDLGRSLVQAMRMTHGKGGIDVCVDCIDRAKRDAGAMRASVVSTAAVLNNAQLPRRVRP